MHFYETVLKRYVPAEDKQWTIIEARQSNHFVPIPLTVDKMSPGKKPVSWSELAILCRYILSSKIHREASFKRLVEDLDNLGFRFFIHDHMRSRVTRDATYMKKLPHIIRFANDECVFQITRDRKTIIMPHYPQNTERWDTAPFNSR